MNFPDIGGLLKFLFICLLVTVPLALWKVIDVIVWIVPHIHIS